MKLRIALLAAAAVLGAATSAGAVGATATATATIINPGQVSATRNLVFGTIAKPSSGSTSNTVTVASSSATSTTPTIGGTGNAFVPTSGLANAATFHLVGAANQTYTVASTTLSFTDPGGNLGSVGAEAPVAQFGAFSSGTGNGTLPADGLEDLHVGGHFTVSPTTAANTYNGTLSITINFN